MNSMLNRNRSISGEEFRNIIVEEYNDNIWNSGISELLNILKKYNYIDNKFNSESVFIHDFDDMIYISIEGFTFTLRKETDSKTFIKSDSIKVEGDYFLSDIEDRYKMINFNNLWNYCMERKITKQDYKFFGKYNKSQNSYKNGNNVLIDYSTDKCYFFVKSEIIDKLSYSYDKYDEKFIDNFIDCGGIIVELEIERNQVNIDFLYPTYSSIGASEIIKDISINIIELPPHLKERVIDRKVDGSDNKVKKYIYKYFGNK